jgi:hypothetical protein
VNRAGWLLLLGGGLLLMKSKPAQASSSGARSTTVDLSLLAELPRFRRWPVRLQRVAWLLERWAETGELSLDEQAVLLTIAYVESAYNVNAVSGPDAPDAAVGDAHSMFQITGNTAETLGVDLRQLRVYGANPTAEDFRDAVRANADAAIRFVTFKPARTRPRTWLEWVRTTYPGDEAALAREAIIIWAGGHGRSWDFDLSPDRLALKKVAVNPKVGSGGYIHNQLATRFRVWPYFRAALGLPQVAFPRDLKVSPEGASLV